MTKYDIRHNIDGTCKLVSVVPTNFGGDAVNFVCEGTYEYCERVKARLEEADKTRGPA